MNQDRRLVCDATAEVVENPDVVYGQFREAAHLSGYAWSRVCDQLEWLLTDNRWRQVGPGFTDIQAFLATVDLSPFNMERSERKGLAEKLTALGASQRAIAAALGVNQATVSRDAHASKPDVEHEATDGSRDAHESPGEPAPPAPEVESVEPPSLEEVEQVQATLAHDIDHAPSVEQAELRAAYSSSKVGASRLFNLAGEEVVPLLSELERKMAKDLIQRARVWCADWERVIDQVGLRLVR